MILRLDRPISVRGKSGDPLAKEEREVSEIDLGGRTEGVRDEDIGKTRFIVSGTLRHAETVHHLRPIIMEVTGVARTDDALLDGGRSPDGRYEVRASPPFSWFCSDSRAPGSK